MNMENELKSRVFSEILQSSRELGSIISDVNAKGKLSLFMDKLSKDPTLQALLFLHRSDLFSLEGELAMPYFYYCKLRRKAPQEEMEPPKALTTIGEDEKLKADSLMNSVAPSIGIAGEEALERLRSDALDILFYFLIKFIRSNDELKVLINSSEDFTYPRMKEVLKDYKGVSWDVFKELEDLFKDKPGVLDNHIKNTIEGYISRFLSFMGRNLIQFSTSQQYITFPYHQLSSFWMSKILRKSGLSFEQYSAVLTEMYSHKLISNSTTIYWCENCYIDEPVFEQTTGRVAPNQLSKKKCVKCGKNMAFSTIYAIDETLRDALLNKDGIMAVLLGYLLGKERIKYELPYKNKYENDFLIEGKKGYILVECKMFRTDSDDVTVKSQLEEGISQLIKHIKALKDEGKEVIKGYFVWNHDSEIRQNPIEHISRKYEIDKHQIIDGNSLPKLIESIKNESEMKE